MMKTFTTLSGTQLNVFIGHNAELKILCCWRLMYVFIILVKVTEWPPFGKIAAHSAYEMFSWYK